MEWHPLVGGATAVFAQSGAGSAVLSAAGEAGGLIGDVLADLVEDGTIDQEQADAIADALVERRTELREQAEALREQMREFLADGTLSAEGLAQLRETHPLRNLDQYLEDGQLTRDELRELRGIGFGPGHHFRGHWGGPRIEVPAAPETDPETDGSGSSTL